jgi:hypothetical protein
MTLRERCYRIACRIFRREIIRDGFRGILGREPEEEALDAYAGSFKELGTGGVIKELSGSTEAWENQKRAHVEELIREAYLGVLGREPEEEALGVYGASFKELGTGGVIKELSNSTEAWENQKRAHVEELIREAYLGVLGREPEEEALGVYGASFKELGTGGVIKELSNSTEAWENQKRAHVEELIREAYLGVLGREPEEEALGVYGASFKELGTGGVIKEMINSEEFFYTLNTRSATWEKVQEKLVYSVYLGLLDRAPDETGRDVYSKLLKQWEDLSIVISSIASGRGHMEKMARDNSHEIFIDFCSRILKSALSPHEIEKASARFGNSSNLGDLLEGAFTLYHREEAQIKRRISPTKKLKPKRVIFLHAEKTGGTSIQAMLSKSLSADEIFCEHDDTMYWRSPSEINKYKVLCGHFNYDTTRLFTPGDNQLVTMVREPGMRILSLYNFWRAHHETHPNHTIYHSIAWEKGFAEFLKDDKIILSRHVLNNMAWYIAGEEVWNEWRTMINFSEDEQRNYLATIVTPFLQKRMDLFGFIGIQEKFSESVSKIYRLIGKEPPTMILKENSFEGNVLSAAHFRKDITAKRIINDHEKKEIYQVAKIDDIIYKIALTNFNKNK